MRFLITAGGTREYIDPVRFISNASSGKMGYALAASAVKCGHDVTLISANVTLPVPENVSVIKAQTAEEMFNAVKAEFAECDCLIMAAAVSDYTPTETSEQKIKKSDSELIIKLKPTADILKWAGKHKGKGQKVIGFALEDKDIESRAEKKLIEKNLDMIIANAPSTIASDSAEVTIKTPDTDWLTFASENKSTLAEKVIALAEKLF
ncbi:MAG: phosphopantothenoylcysteine decarboxylase [Phycisphaerae bacterium]|nr:phosphopantothenoylcysteine decarboxylase [Phycisphaerae bacterium]